MDDIILKTDEKILLKIRSFILINFWPFFTAFLILCLDAFFMFHLFRQGLWGEIVFGVAIAFALFIFWRSYFLWKKNVFIITNKRIIDVEQRSFLDKTVSEIYYNQVEDVLTEVKGFFSSLFRCGDLVIQVKKNRFKIIVPKIKNALKIQQLINSLKEKYLEKTDLKEDEDLLEFLKKKINDLDFDELENLKRFLNKRINNFD